MSKVALVTGANQGIGYGIVRRLCKEHPSMIVYGTSRSAVNGEEACKKLKEEGLTAKFVEADITKRPTITALKEKLVKDHGGLDILINNAGMAFKKAATESYDIQAEVTIETNVHGTHAVCEEMFPILNDGARVVILSSLVAPMVLHKTQTLNPSRYEMFIKDDPPMSVDEVIQCMKDFVNAVKAGVSQEQGWPETAYGHSKLADTLLARAYQKHFDEVSPERDILVNAADPGYVNTNMTSYGGPLTIDEGADTPYYLAVLPPKSNIRGEHVGKREVIPWK